MLVATAVAGSLWGQKALAQFNSGDLVLGIRSSTAASTNLVIDLGSAASFDPYQGTANPNGSAVTLSSVNATLLNSVFGNMNNLYFSVFGYVDQGNPQGLAQPVNTIFLTKPENGSGVTSPSSSLSSGAQSQTIGYLAAMFTGASTSTAISTGVAGEVASLANPGSISYAKGIQNNLNPSSPANIHGTWARYNPEGTTGASFSSGVSLDLYQQVPGAAAGTLLGTFNLDPTGAFTFQPAPEPTSVALLGGGLLAIAAVRRFNRKS